MSKAHDSHGCTYPSGDGSLRWLCPTHTALPNLNALILEDLERTDRAAMAEAMFAAMPLSNH